MSASGRTDRPVRLARASGLGTTPRDRTDLRHGGGEGRSGALLGASFAGRSLVVLASGRLHLPPSREWMIGLYDVSGSSATAQGLRRRGHRHCRRTNGRRAASDAVRGRPGPRALAALHGQGPGTTTEPLAVAFGAARVRVREDRDAGRTGPARGRPPRSAGRGADPLAVDRHRAHQLWGGLPLGHDEDDALGGPGARRPPRAARRGARGGQVERPVAHRGRSRPRSGRSSSGASTASSSSSPPGGRAARRFVGCGRRGGHGERSGNCAPRWRTATPGLLERGLRKVDRDTGLGLVVVVIDELALYPRASRRRETSSPRCSGTSWPEAGPPASSWWRPPRSRLRRRADLDPGPLRVPAGPAVLDPGRLGHRARGGLGGRGLLGLRHRPRPPGRRYLLAEGSLPRRMRCFVLGDDHLAAAGAARRAPAGDGP